ncbi:MAG: hypothetical protein GX205_04395 [Firmicutes bacterium]|jgi:hypothetical protein|nr:hypothetical protein [Bacillota bacterium]
MKYERYVPVLIITVILGALVYAQVRLGNQNTPGPDTGEEIRLQAATVNNKLDDIDWFDVEIELMNDAEIEVTYSAGENQDPRARIRRGDQPDQPEITGQDAINQVESIVAAIPPLTSNEPLNLVQAILDQLQIAQSDVDEFEVEYQLKDGTRGAVELDVKGLDDDDFDVRDDRDD